MDTGRLWGRPLCGPVRFGDYQTHAVVTSRHDQAACSPEQRALESDAGERHAATAGGLAFRFRRLEGDTRWRVGGRSQPAVIRVLMRPRRGPASPRPREY